MMSCDFDMLSRYLDGDLPLPVRRELDVHLAQCARCARDMEILSRNDRVLRAWGQRHTAVPATVEHRITRDIGRRRRLGPLIAFSKMMPAALGTSAAALLVLVTASLGGSYMQRESGNAATASAASRSAIVKQSAQLIMNRRSQAIVAGRPVQQPDVGSVTRLFDKN